MVSDARLNIGFPHHPKTQKLKRRLGADGAWSLVCLILWTAANKSNGVLSGMTHEDIAIAAGWEGQTEEFVKALIEVGFLDQLGDSLALHDWVDHNPYAWGAAERSEKSRYAALCRHHCKEKAQKIMEEIAQAKGESAARMRSAENRSAPSPNPKPNPNPEPRSNPAEKDGLASVIDKPDEVDSDIWKDFLALRERLGLPLNKTAWNHMSKELERGKDQRYSVNDMLSEVVASGWKTFKLDWFVERRKTNIRSDPADRILNPPERWLK